MSVSLLCVDVDVDVSLDGDGDERVSEGARAADVYTNHNRQTEQAQSTIMRSILTILGPAYLNVSKGAGGSPPEYLGVGWG